MTRRLTATLALLAALLALPGRSAVGQLRSMETTPLPELRLDVLSARHTGVQLGAGLALDAGTYVRLVALAAAGATWRDGETLGSGRVDALARFVLDPFAQRRWSLYGVGGVGALFERGARARPVLIVGVGLEGPPSRGVIPAIDVGAGGGLRVGISVRRAREGHR